MSTQATEQQTEPQYTEVLDDDDLESVGEAGGLSKTEQTNSTMPFAVIYARLLQHGAIEVEIYDHQSDLLRRGVTDAKYHSNQKALKAGIQADTRRIEYAVVGENSEKHTMKVRISFNDSGLSVLSIKAAGADNVDDEEM